MMFGFGYSWFVKTSYSSAGDCVAIFARCMGALGNSLSPAAHAPCEASLVPVDAFPATASESLSSAQMAPLAQL
jgi:hypothetical protein